MNKEVKQNLITYGALLFIALAGLIYGKSIFNDYHFLRVWDYSNLLILIIGVPFLFFQTKAGLPNFWQSEVVTRDRFIYPVLIGIIFGALDILVIKIMLHPEPYTELPPFLQPFPYSIFLYTSGAFDVEVFYRLIPITIILLFGNRYKEGKFFTYFFWAAALLTSLREPLEQLPGGNIALILYSFITGFAMNLLQAMWYRKAGFVAALFVRLGHYLLWHILLGVYVEFFELL
jgi:hypothetical protein